MVTAYDLKLHRNVEIVNPKKSVITTKNGARIEMVMGTSAESGNRVSRILSNVRVKKPIKAKTSKGVVKPKVKRTVATKTKNTVRRTKA